MTESSIPLFKTCTKCKQEFPCTTDHFYRHKTSKHGLSVHCKQCHLTISKRAYRKKSKERLQKTKARTVKLKAEVLKHYGNGECKCLWCGFDNVAALTLDHINDDGYSEPRSGHQLYAYLRKLGFPSGFQTLCMNCQYIKRDANGNSTRIRPHEDCDRG